MDAESKKQLEGILAKGLSAVTEDDAAFLRARQSYLTKAQQEEYAEFLDAPKKPEKKKGEKE